jgi:chromosomal replication initiation ATPase DnaA
LLRVYIVLKKQLTAYDYESWIQPLKLVDVKGNTLYLRARSELGLKFLKDLYTEKIETALSEVTPSHRNYVGIFFDEVIAEYHNLLQSPQLLVKFVN